MPNENNSGSTHWGTGEQPVSFSGTTNRGDGSLNQIRSYYTANYVIGEYKTYSLNPKENEKDMGQLEIEDQTVPALEKALLRFYGAERIMASDMFRFKKSVYLYDTHVHPNMQFAINYRYLKERFEEVIPDDKEFKESNSRWLSSLNDVISDIFYEAVLGHTHNGNVHLRETFIDYMKLSTLDLARVMATYKRVGGDFTVMHRYIADRELKRQASLVYDYNKKDKVDKAYGGILGEESLPLPAPTPRQRATRSRTVEGEADPFNTSW